MVRRTIEASYVEGAEQAARVTCATWGLGWVTELVGRARIYKDQYLSQWWTCTDRGSDATSGSLKLRVSPRSKRAWISMTMLEKVVLTKCGLVGTSNTCDYDILWNKSARSHLPFWPRWRIIWLDRLVQWWSCHSSGKATSKSNLWSIQCWSHTWVRLDL